MSLPNAVIDAMLAAGCTAEQLAAAMKAANGADEARRETKRAGNAERQQRFRDARKSRKDAPKKASNARNDSNALRGVTPPIDNTHTPTPDISSDEESQSQRDDVSAVIESWNEMAAPLELAVCRKLTGTRLKACQARLRDDGLQAIQAAIKHIPNSAFLRGEVGNWSGANVSFLLKPDTVTKILEGQYDDRSNRNNSGARPAGNGGKPKDGVAAALDRRLGLDDTPGPSGRRHAGDGAGNRGLALVPSRTLL